MLGFPELKQYENPHGWVATITRAMMAKGRGYRMQSARNRGFVFKSVDGVQTRIADRRHDKANAPGGRNAARYQKRYTN